MDGNPYQHRASAEVKANRKASGRAAEEKKGEVTPYANPFGLVQRQLHRLISAVGARPALAHHPRNIGAVETDALERGTNSYKCMKQALHPKNLDLESLKHLWKLFNEWRTLNAVSVS